MKKRLSVLLAFVMLVVSLVMPISVMAGNSFDKAEELVYDQECLVTVNPCEYQYYSFTAIVDGLYVIESVSSTYDNSASLFDGKKEFICEDDNSGVGDNFKIEANLEAGKKYYLRVDGEHSDEIDSGKCRVLLSLPSDVKANEFDVQLDDKSYSFTGKAIMPKETVMLGDKLLIKDVDYKLYYQNNTKVGQGIIYVVGIGEYGGVQKVNFDITPTSISNCTVSIAKNEYTFSPTGVTPAVSVKLNGVTISSSNYQLKYIDNKKVGTATIYVNGQGGLTGTKTLKFKITKKNVTGVVMHNQIYTGKKVSPKVYYTKKTKYWCEECKDFAYHEEEVAYKNGTDYTIKISGDGKSLGEYTATITFKGNYSGTVKKKFKIQLGEVKNIKSSNRKIKSIDYSWSKVAGAEGYKIYRYNQKTKKYEYYKTTSSTKATIYRVNKNDNYLTFRIRAYKKVGKKTYYSYLYSYGDGSFKPSQASFTLSKSNGVWKTKFSKKAYYQYQVSTDKDFKKTVINKYGEYSSYTNKALKKGTKYYVRAREYKVIKGKNEYGKWSQVKTIK